VWKKFFPAMSSSTVLLALGLLNSCNFPDRANGPEGKPQRQEVYEIAKEKRGLVLDCESAATQSPAKVAVIVKVTTSAGEPMTSLSCKDFVLFEDSLRISPTESAFRALNRPQDFHMSALLLLDLSGSIAGSDFDSLKLATQQFIRNLFQSATGSSLKTGIYWFDGGAKINPWVDFTADTSRLQDYVKALKPELSTDRSTNLNGAIVAGLETIKAEVKKQKMLFVSHGVLVLFTDGTDQAARYTSQRAQSEIDTSGAAISVYTIGLGDEIDLERLRAFGKDGFAFANKAGQLSQKFAETAAHIQNNVKSRYLIEYCSPKRSGRHSLTVTAFEPLTRYRYGSVTVSFPADGFEGGCSLEEACAN